MGKESWKAWAGIYPDGWIEGWGGGSPLSWAERSG